MAADLSGLYLDCPYYEGPLTGYLRVEPGDGRPKVSGLMQVDNTTVDIPLALASSSDGPDLDLDFTLTWVTKFRLTVRPCMT